MVRLLLSKCVNLREIVIYKENPYVDVKLYPQDNWKEILAAYVRKSAIPSIVEVEAALLSRQ